jgi:hypothetical protein
VSTHVSVTVHILSPVVITRDAVLIITAKFVVNIRGYTADDDDMVCLDLMVDFVS